MAANLQGDKDLTGLFISAEKEGIQEKDLQDRQLHLLKL